MDEIQTGKVDDVCVLGPFLRDSVGRCCRNVFLVSALSFKSLSLFGNVDV